MSNPLFLNKFLISLQHYDYNLEVRVEVGGAGEATEDAVEQKVRTILQLGQQLQRAL